MKHNIRRPTILRTGLLARYRTLHRALLGLAICGITTASFAAAPKEITWDDLLSPTLFDLEEQSNGLRQRFHGLMADEKIIYRAVSEELSLRERLESKELTETLLTDKERTTLEEKLSAKYPNAIKFWDQVKTLNDEIQKETNRVDPTLDGKLVKMPGYVLPLQSEGGKVFEFMLVPYVGACVHTPPPPPNQLVYVKSDKGFSSERLYTPVWVEGVMSTTSDSYDLSFRDGSREIDAGYTINANTVETYEQ